MKKIFMGFALFVLCSISLNAQNKIDKINMTYGEELPDDKQKIVKIVGESNNKIFALAIKGKDDYFIKIFESGSMKLVSSNPIVIPQISDKEVDFEEIFLLNDKDTINSHLYKMLYLYFYFRM